MSCTNKNEAVKNLYKGILDVTQFHCSVSLENGWFGVVY